MFREYQTEYSSLISRKRLDGITGREAYSSRVSWAWALEWEVIHQASWVRITGRRQSAPAAEFLGQAL